MVISSYGHVDLNILVCYQLKKYNNLLYLPNWLRPPLRPASLLQPPNNTIIEQSSTIAKDARSTDQFPEIQIGRAFRYNDNELHKVTDVLDHSVTATRYHPPGESISIIFNDPDELSELCILGISKRQKVT